MNNLLLLVGCLTALIYSHGKEVKVLRVPQGPTSTVPATYGELKKCQVTVFLSGITILMLQFYVLLRPRSSQYCSQPLLTNLVGNIIFTFFAIGFTVLLTQMELVPKALRRMFSVFGVGSFCEGVLTIVLTFLATDCEKTTPELYYLSVLLAVSSLVSTDLRLWPVEPFPAALSPEHPSKHVTISNLLLLDEVVSWTSELR